MCPASLSPPGHQRGVRSQAESLDLGPGSLVGITTISHWPADSDSESHTIEAKSELAKFRNWNLR